MKNVVGCASLAAAVLAAMTLTAKADGIVLESYTGDKPGDAARYVAPLLEELAKKKYHAGYEAIGRPFEATVSRPSATPAGLPKTFKADVEHAKGEWARGKFDEALKLLVPLVDAAHVNPAAFIDDQALRDALQDALVTMALSRRGQGDLDGMQQAFAELMRSFPNATPGPSYGPDANRAFEAVRKQLSGQSGAVVVQVNDDNTPIYIDEQFAKVGRGQRDGIPGDYRVVVGSKHLSRLHRAVVTDHGTAQVVVDLAFDRALHFAPDWTGLSFPTAGDRQQLEGAYASRIAQSIGASAVAVVGTDVVQGRTVIVGAMINISNGRELRRATIAADAAPPVERLHALADFLDSGTPPTGSGIDVVVNGNGAGPPLPTTRQPGGDITTAPVAERPSAGRWHGWKWISGGAAVGTLAGGTLALIYNGKCSKQATDDRLPCPDKYDNRALAAGLLGGGAVLAGLTVYLWLTEAPAPPSKTAYLIPTAGGAVAGFWARF